AGCRQAARGRPPAPATPREVGCVHTACSLQQAGGCNLPICKTTKQVASCFFNGRFGGFERFGSFTWRVTRGIISSKDSEISQPGNSVDDDAIADDDVWDDVSDSPGHGSTLDREWVHRQNQFHKMGYRDGIAEGQKDIAQEGFNVGFGQSVHVGYKWGLVRGITSALASLPDSLKEKLLPNVQCRGQLQELNNSVQEISAEDALQMFHESILQSSHSSEEPDATL
ncbi:Os10g0580500, partial [Oryza sativa Japonica Group]